MKDATDQTRVDLRTVSLSLITTYPPTRCGIGRFSYSLVEALGATAPDVDVRVARISDSPTTSAESVVDVAFDPSSPVARRTAARRISAADAVILQHEYGLYGPDDGIAVLDLVARIDAPLITVVHTVRPAPSPRQRTIIEFLGEAGVLVVLSEVARQQLLEAHQVDPAGVYVIPHGSSWTPAAVPERLRRRLITWGLLGPGKGIERALEAVAQLKLDPPVTYDIVGQTHPNVLARQGRAYRDSLEKLARGLGLDRRVRFVDRYVSDAELEKRVAASDVVVLPYDNEEQVCSGVLTDAVALGRPVVATAFPHALEFARRGCGRAVEHRPGALAASLEELLTDDTSYRMAVTAAGAVSPSLSWSRVALAYVDLVDHLRSHVVVA